VHLILAAFLGLSHRQAASIDAIVASVMAREHIAGLSLGIARKDARLYLRGYGFRSPGKRADGFTIYAAGSIAKQFTAALVAQQVAAGRLALDGSTHPTVRELLDQTAGGTWAYRNENYAALGEILERNDGQPFCALLAQRILQPLQLISTGCAAAPASFNVASGSIAPYESIAPAAGGLWTNAVDLLRWLSALQEGRVVSSDLFASMTSSGTAGGVPVNYGFGFFTANWYGYRTVYHGGNVDGYSSEDALVLDDGLEVAVLSNADRVDLVPLVKSVVTIIDAPRDANLYGRPGGMPQNENPRIRERVVEYVRAQFAQLGPVENVEFIERTVAGGIAYDRYRVTFENARRWVTATYDKDETILSLTFSVDER